VRAQLGDELCTGVLDALGGCFCGTH
jgi:hypothetical protein